MPTTKIFVKLCSIINALVSGMWTSITLGSRLAHERLGIDSSRLNQERERALGVRLLFSRDGYCSSDVFHGELHAHKYES